MATVSRMFDGPTIELHITNIHRCEPVCRDCLISDGGDGGRGLRRIDSEWRSMTTYF
jgi:3-dehydroquinate dehydratase